MDQETQSARRIPKYLNQTDQVFGRDSHDVGLLIGGPTLIAMAMLNYASFLPSAARIPVAVAFIGTGVVLLAKQPKHLSATEWIGAVLHGVFMPSKMNHLASAAGMERETTDFVETENWWETSEPTQTLTGVRRIHPTIDEDIGLIEREDGALVGAVEVHGVNMALATSDMWEARVRELASFLNTLEYPVQIYVTTDAFDIDEHTAQYQDRADDRDIQARPILRAVLEAYNERVIPSIEQGGLNRRRYYFVVQADEEDIYTGEESEGGSDLPVVGRFLGDDGASGDFDEEDTRDMMAEEVKQRLEAVVSNVKNIEGCDAERVPSGELARLIHEYWSGTHIDSDVQDRFERIMPIVVGEESIHEKREEADMLDDEGGSMTGDEDSGGFGLQPGDEEGL
jgi:hypothetical protein